MIATTTVDEINVEQFGSRLTIRFDAPDRLNAVTAAMLDRVTETVTAASSEPSVRVLVLTGAGRAFCSGADLGVEADRGTVQRGPDTSTIDAANRLTTALVRSEKPVICALNGLAAGVGVSLALSCDIIVARDDAYFLLAFTRIGLMPDGGATALVAASLGRSRALQLALLAEKLPVAEAHAAGMVWRCFDADSFDGEIDALAQRLASGPTTALGATKVAVNAAALGSLDAALSLERVGQIDLMTGPEFAEGVAAFLDKRPAVFES